MVVYADILIVTNLIVDFFLLKLTLKILKTDTRHFRIVLSSGIGSLFSLYIFLPQNHLLVEIGVRLLMNFIMILVCIGFKSLKSFFRAVLTLFTVTYGFGGIMTAFWQLVKPPGMIINNSVVYFNISPIILIGFTVLGYFLYLFFSKTFSLPLKNAERCEISVTAMGNTVGTTAIIDSGNSITDTMSNSEIIIADKSVVIALFGTDNAKENQYLLPRYRAIPCSTVSGTDMLTGFRCDSGKIILKDKTITLNKPILAVSKSRLRDGYCAILNPEILKIECDNNESDKTAAK